MDSEVGCFAGFCHHHLAIMSAHTHAHHYPYLEVEQNQVCKESLYVERYSTVM